MPLILIISAFAALVGNGGAPRASIALGKKQTAEAEQILGNCFVTQLLVSAVLTAVVLIWNRPLLLAFGASSNTIDYSAAYMNIYALGTVFVQLTLGMNAFITAQGFAKVGMLSVLIGAVANTALDPLFIFGFHMGVRGAALATVLSQGLSCLWVLSFLISVCFNTSLLKYGGDLAVGAMTILTSVMQFAMLPLQGLGQGAQPIISYNYGAGNSNRVRRAYRLLLTCSVCYAMLFCLLIQLFPGVFAAIFTSNAELLTFTKPMLRIYTLALGLFGIQIACQMTFTSLGNAKASIIVAVMRKFILLLPLIYIMPHLYTADLTKAVFMAEPVADVLAVAFTGVLFFFEFRKALRAMPKSEKRS